MEDAAKKESEITKMKNIPRVRDRQITVGTLIDAVRYLIEGNRNKLKGNNTAIMLLDQIVYRNNNYIRIHDELQSLKPTLQFLMKEYMENEKVRNEKDDGSGVR